MAEVNPDLVVRDKNGEIYTVRYDAVNAMLQMSFLDAVFTLFAGPTGLLFHASLQLRKLIRANEYDRHMMIDKSGIDPIH